MASHAKKPIVAIIGGGALMLGMAALAYPISAGSPPSTYFLTLVLALAGVVIGWLLGFLLSPYTLREAARFREARAAASAFVSGYLISKLDPALASLLSPERLSADPGLILSRIALFTAAVIIGALTMYTYREYLWRASGASLQPSAAEPQ